VPKINAITNVETSKYSILVSKAIVEYLTSTEENSVKHVRVKFDDESEYSITIEQLRYFLQDTSKRSINNYFLDNFHIKTLETIENIHKYPKLKVLKLDYYWLKKILSKKTYTYQQAIKEIIDKREILIKLFTSKLKLQLKYHQELLEFMPWELHINKSIS